uniref:Apolipoprotein B n=1 Tax=Schistocephalus solidus TaxID=70667 RepID=A0A183SN67_SCHSO
LEKNAADLKHVLSRIPTEIGHRNEFIALIKQIANAIKNLLDCINLILNALTPGVTKQGLDEHMRNFVEYSRKFSSALKKFFRDHGLVSVSASPNC